MNFVYRKADLTDLEKIWDKNIRDHKGDRRWIRWKEEMLKDNSYSKAATFVIICDGEPVGEGTVLFSPKCKAIRNRKMLCDGSETANLNALRIQKEYERKGHISKLVKEIEKYAMSLGYSYLTIGVEARETRNLAIYLHFGYDEFLMSAKEDGELVLYFRKKLNKE